MKLIRNTSIYSYLLFAIAFIIIQSCTNKNDVVDREQIELDNWVNNNIVPWANQNGYNLEKTASGLYYISIHQGIGSKPSINDYVLVSTTSKKIDGSIFSTDSSEVAKANGIYDHRIYYAPKLYSIKSLNTNKFAESLLKMKEGEKARLIYTSSNSEVSPLDITIDLLKIFHSSEEYENELMNSYIETQMPNSQNIDVGIYLKKIDINPSGNSIIEKDTVKLSYMIWYLNNQLIDTNIEDSAKINNIYDPEFTYKPIEFLAGSKDLILGINKIVLNMKYNETAFTVFSSKYGYGENGNNFIPAYCPFKMYLKIQSK